MYFFARDHEYWDVECTLDDITLKDITQKTQENPLIFFYIYFGPGWFDDGGHIFLILRQNCKLLPIVGYPCFRLSDVPVSKCMNVIGCTLGCLRPRDLAAWIALCSYGLRLPDAEIENQPLLGNC